MGWLPRCGGARGLLAGCWWTYRPWHGTRGHRRGRGAEGNACESCEKCRGVQSTQGQCFRQQQSFHHSGARCKDKYIYIYIYMIVLFFSKTTDLITMYCPHISSCSVKTKNWNIFPFIKCFLLHAVARILLCAQPVITRCVFFGSC